jgi:hypothetical protein
MSEINRDGANTFGPGKSLLDVIDAVNADGATEFCGISTEQSNWTYM